ncbi:hypothetical protein VTP01DRAFT_7145 [Rhizomucor pusillus]|uniref:uncharacterized protein n=1 Tax=Rhizomucor pusillus TaxID=4840 RepID=UPI003742C555
MSLLSNTLFRQTGRLLTSIRPSCSPAIATRPVPSRLTGKPTTTVLTRKCFGTRPALYAAAQSSKRTVDRPPRDEEITAKFIKLIDEKGELVHEKARTEDVLRTIDRNQFFLVQVDPRSAIPTCRLFDKKQLFEKQKAAKKNKNANPAKVTKEIMFGWNVSPHDMEHKLAKAKEFLEKGNKVMVEIVHKKGQLRPSRDEEKQLIERVSKHLDSYKLVKGPLFAKGMCTLQFQKTK